jgi:hypothetical protein
MSNNPSENQTQASTSTPVSSPSIEKKQSSPANSGSSKSPYSSYYGSSSGGFGDSSMNQQGSYGGGNFGGSTGGYGGYPPQGGYYGESPQGPQSPQGQYGQYGTAPYSNQPYGGQQYGNQPMYGQAPQGSQPIQPQYNQVVPPQYNQPQQYQQVAPSNVTQAYPQGQQGQAQGQQGQAQPFAFFPTLEGVNKTASTPNYSALPATPNQAHLSQAHMPQPNIQPNMQAYPYQQPAANVQNQIYTSFAELQKLKNRFHSIVHRNPDILPDQFKNAFKFTNFVKTSTIVSIFFYSAFKTSYMIQSGADKKLVFMRCANFFLAYMFASFGFNIIETRQLERAFHYSYGSMSIPMIDEELRRLNESNPVLRY